MLRNKCTRNAQLAQLWTRLQLATDVIVAAASVRLVHTSLGGRSFLGMAFLHCPSVFSQMDRVRKYNTRETRITLPHSMELYRLATAGVAYNDEEPKYFLNVC